MIYGSLSQLLSILCFVNKPFMWPYALPQWAGYASSAGQIFHNNSKMQVHISTWNWLRWWYLLRDSPENIVPVFADVILDRSKGYNQRSLTNNMDSSPSSITWTNTLPAKCFDSFWYSLLGLRSHDKYGGKDRRPWYWPLKGTCYLWGQNSDF